MKGLKSVIKAVGRSYPKTASVGVLNRKELISSKDALTHGAQTANRTYTELVFFFITLFSNPEPMNKIPLLEHENRDEESQASRQRAGEQSGVAAECVGS
jgi:hypothetical protein